MRSRASLAGLYAVCALLSAGCAGPPPQQEVFTISETPTTILHYYTEVEFTDVGQVLEVEGLRLRLIGYDAGRKAASFQCPPGSDFLAGAEGSVLHKSDGSPVNGIRVKAVGGSGVVLWIRGMRIIERPNVRKVDAADGLRQGCNAKGGSEQTGHQ